MIDELSHEVERLRSAARTPALPTTSPETLRLEELHQEVSTLRSENRALQECNEELQASLLTAGVEQGRLLTVVGETSLAAELEAMSHDQVSCRYSSWGPLEISFIRLHYIHITHTRRATHVNLGLL